VFDPEQGVDVKGEEHRPRAVAQSGEEEDGEPGGGPVGGPRREPRRLTFLPRVR
jgi:hypothetical protein